MADFKAIETQEELDSIIEQKLKEERERIQTQYNGYLSPDDVKKAKDRYEAKIEELNRQLQTEAGKSSDMNKTLLEKDAEIKKYHTASLKSKIANEIGLSYGAIDFIKGEDEDSIRESATSLKGLMGGGFVPPLANNEDKTDSQEEALRNTLKELNGKGE